MSTRDASFTELRNQAKHYFDLVESGEIVRVLRNGKPIAEIHPIPRDLPSWKRRPARPLVIGGRRVSSLILEERGKSSSDLAVAVIAVPEAISSFCRLVREGRLSDAQYAAVKGDLRADLADAILFETSPHVVQRAIAALEAHPLRAMDAIHIGAALVSGADVFISADSRQRAAATQLGLDVVSL